MKFLICELIIAKYSGHADNILVLSARPADNTRMFQRKAIVDLTKWYQDSNRKPLLLRGARQVGKSTLVRMLAEKLNLNLVEINLEIDSKLRTSFKTLNTAQIIQDIEIYTNKSLSLDSTLLFIDEIQEIPEAIQSLRYFYEKTSKLAVIAAGSLLEFALSDAIFSMPVGRIEFYYLGPIKFSEYLSAKNENSLLEVLETSNLSETAHEMLHERLIEFYSIGGMPEAVAKFIETKSFHEVQRVHYSIIQTYKADFHKYKKRIPIHRIEKVFDFAAEHVGEKVKYSNISRDEQARELKAALDCIIKACVIYPVFHSNCSGVPINAGKNDKYFKLLFLDIGLMNTIQKLDLLTLKALFSKSNLRTNLLTKGKITEQFIGQQMLFNNPLLAQELFYWAREEKSSNAEVDYVIQNGIDIIPIEVKSGESGSMKSMLQFAIEKQPRLAVKFTSQRAMEKTIITDKGFFKLLHLPHYQAEYLSQIVNKLGI